MITLYLFCGVAIAMPIFFIERRQNVDDWQTLMLKCLSTFLMVYLSLMNYVTFKGEVLYFALSITGLILCLAGDFLLGYCHLLPKENVKHNVIRGIGMLVFMFAHITFIVNYIMHISNFIVWLIVFPIVFGIICMFFAPKMGIKWPHKSLIAISLFYIITISLMLMCGAYYSIQLLTEGGKRNIIRGVFILIASISFFASDSILSFMYFGGKKGRAISIVNLSTYYLSLFLLALAA